MKNKEINIETHPWFIGINEEDSELLRRSLEGGGKRVVERVIQEIDKYLLMIQQEEINESSFDSPNWAYKQAFNNGKKTQLARIREWLMTVM